MNKIFLTLGICVMLTACGAGVNNKRTLDVRIGMSEKQVLSIMGKPYTMSQRQTDSGVRGVASYRVAPVGTSAGCNMYKGTMLVFTLGASSVLKCPYTEYVVVYFNDVVYAHGKKADLNAIKSSE